MFTRAEIASSAFGLLAMTATSFVMRGLDPRIHRREQSYPRMMDCRVKPGNDEPRQGASNQT
jgi:hypothetical protein